MAFFDELEKMMSGAGQKLNEVGNQAVQKTKDFSEIARLTSAKADEERKLEEMYRAIGEKYVYLHKEDAEECMADMVTAVREKQNMIMQLETQIQDRKNNNRCPVCGAQIAEGAAFCGCCGAPLNKRQPSGNMYGQQPSGNMYGQQPSGNMYGQQPSGNIYGQQPSADMYEQKAAEKQYDQQPSVDMYDQKNWGQTCSQDDAKDE